MITRAFIEDIVDEHHVKIRIPFFNKAASAQNSTRYDDLYIATISTIPNCTMNFQIGDAVFVGFEDHSAGKPVVLGQLSRAEKTNNYATLNVETIKANVDAYLPSNTFIGDISSAEIQCLKGANNNLQAQIEILSTELAKLKDRVEKLEREL